MRRGHFLCCNYSIFTPSRYFFFQIKTVHKGAKIHILKISTFKNHVFKISHFIKFTFSESHFSQNSHFHKTIFQKIHISGNLIFSKFKIHIFQTSNYIKSGVLPQCDITLTKRCMYTLLWLIDIYTQLQLD